jgi:hypothetical protein
MKQTSKYIQSLTVIFILLWTGASVIRSSIGYSLFEIADVFKLRDNINPNELFYTIKTYINITFYVDLFYILSFIFISILFISGIKHLKSTGWLLMSVVLFYLFSVSEIYLILNDIDLYYYNLRSIGTQLVSDGSLHIFKQRYILDLFKIVQPMSFLSHIAIAFFIMHKPLVKNEN